ncbi:unnamed protein product, partial [Protopolystoma xenopodis]
MQFRMFYWLKSSKTQRINSSTVDIPSLYDSNQKVPLPSGELILSPVCSDNGVVSETCTENRCTTYAGLPSSRYRRIQYQSANGSTNFIPIAVPQRPNVARSQHQQQNWPAYQLNADSINRRLHKVVRSKSWQGFLEQKVSHCLNESHLVS